MDSAVVPVDAPSLSDLVVAVVVWGVTSLVKRYVRRRSYAVAIRRFLPLLAVVLGVSVQVAVHAWAGGASWPSAVLRGLYSGAAAVAAHNLYKATWRGELKDGTGGCAGGGA